MRPMLVIAQLTLVRLMRGRAVWVSAIIALLPVIFAGALRARSVTGVRIDLLVFQMLLLAIIPPMFVASSIGEDIEDRTTTYLWSRPIPRWAVVAGKLLALAPASALLLTASWMAASFAGNAELEVQWVAALIAGAVAMSFLSAALATLVPKHGMALTVAYMLFFDLPVGAMPISLAKLSITHQVRAIIGIVNPMDNTTVTGGAIGLAVLALLWLALALWRMRRLEA